MRCVNTELIGASADGQFPLGEDTYLVGFAESGVYAVSCGSWVFPGRGVKKLKLFLGSFGPDSRKNTPLKVPPGFPHKKRAYRSCPVSP